MKPQLDSFETELLRELRTAVEHRDDRRRSARRWLQGAAVAAVAATCGTVAVVAAWGTPAYAVDSTADGLVEVSVNRIEDAAGLEQALEADGVKADITYLGRDKKCAPGRYRELALDSSYRSRSRYSIGTGGIEVTLDRRDVANGETLVISASSIEDGSASSVGIAEGPVAPCQVVEDADGL